MNTTKKVFKNKQEFRKVALRNAQNFIISPQKRAIDAYICHVLDYILTRLIKDIYRCNHRKVNVLFYFPLPLEANILRSMKNLRRQRLASLFVPFMEGVSFKMVSFRMPFLKKKFGIYEPMNSYLKPSKVDIAIVPIIGIDKYLKRIGYGKGMYDRFFATLKNKPITLFVTRNLQFAENSITDAYDIQADLVVAHKIFLTKVKNNVRMDYPKLYWISRCCRRRCLSGLKKYVRKIS